MTTHFRIKIFLLTVFLFHLGTAGCRKTKKPELEILVPASLARVAEELGTVFESNYRIAVHIREVEFSSLNCESEGGVHGDLLLCDHPDLGRVLTNQGCVSRSIPVCCTLPVVVLLKESRYQMQDIEEMPEHPELTLSVPKDSAVLRKIAESVLPEETRFVVDADFQMSPADFLRQSKTDALVTWEFLAENEKDDLQILRFPANFHAIPVETHVLTSCQNVQSCRLFIELLTSKTGTEIFKKHCFRVFSK
ncbi:MAG: substrate-binding domain-containing protein [Planctomycetaceae bacterium]|jgi:ABC-type molybdate transport system substrate-binding protein|nr:substrate-binding domain-containing protein [Planctomycetaceae bacterium]